MDIPQIVTPRLLMEPLSYEHSMGMFELWSDPQVCEHSGPARDLSGDPIPLPASDPEGSDKILEYFLHRAREGTAFRWALQIRAGRAFIGTVGFNTLGSSCELAYHMHPRHWGQGLMFEACRAAADWAFATHGATSLESFVELGNQRSIRLIERLGFVRTGERSGSADRYLRELDR